MSGQSSLNNQPLRVLHVDDHAVNRRLVRDILLSFGHQTVECPSGAEALVELKLQPFDLVLMDINMPGMTGIEAVRRLRSGSGPTRDLPVIALTSEVGRAVENYLALGFSGFVAKPFSIQNLIATIDNCIRLSNRHAFAYQFATVDESWAARTR